MAMNNSPCIMLSQRRHYDDSFILLNALSHIRHLVKQDELCVLNDNANPYRIILKNSAGSYSVYYFSCPVFNRFSKRLVSKTFRQRGDAFDSEGINSRTTLFDRGIEMRGETGQFTILFGRSDNRIERAVRKNLFGDLSDSISYHIGGGMAFNGFPTFNGMYFESAQSVSFKIISDNQNVLNEENGFVYLSSENVPVLIASVYCADTAIKAERANDNTTEICFHNISGHTQGFSLDFHAPKFIFDTPIDCRNPEKNNAYLAWTELTRNINKLCYRYDLDRLADLTKHRFVSATHYIKSNAVNQTIEFQEIASPWCTFGATWENRPETNHFKRQADTKSGYISADISPQLIHFFSDRNNQFFGNIISNYSREHFSVLTADNYIYPNILEIKIKE